jgi:DNA mismatch repair protein MutS
MENPEKREIPRPAQLTPMMRQYLEQKELHPDSILFFRLGDFYEMFFEDAVLASELLEITLTSRDKGENPVPMCGVPHHSSRGYIARLIEKGYKVAICEQVEEPGPGKSIVRREISQVVTPGLVTDTEMISAKEPRYLFALHEGKGGVGYAFLDITTGEFFAGQLPDMRALLEELGRVEPHELIISEEVAKEKKPLFAPSLPVTPVSADFFHPERSAERLREHYGVSDLGGFGLDGQPLAVAAAGALLCYVKSRHRSALSGLRPIARHLGSDFVFLGDATKRNLELFYTLSGERGQGTLLGLMDRTRTPMGGRLLRRWLAFPLMDLARIEERLSAVAEFVQRGELRKNVRETLRKVSDLERLAGKVAIGSANARDLVALRESLGSVPGLRELLKGVDAPLLQSALQDLDPLTGLVDLLSASIADSPPPSLTEGSIIREGYDSAVDELREVQRGGRGWIARLQSAERERTGISSLRIGFNKVFGYYIEISRARLDKVPEGYERRQTLANAERYVTPELKEMESKVLGAEERANALEYGIFLKIREETARHVDQMRLTAGAVALLDTLSSLADLAVARRYVRPHLHEGYELSITGGRHPVVEALSGTERFVPNDLVFDGEQNRLSVITGPNMSGKSTILRQTALIALMAQMGSFVPAEAARIGLVDRIFTRVGASDDLARGRSTFMVEMMESAAILHNATGRSLVILDEIGRGTSTFDGLSIAWAVAEYIHKKGSRTLFATHYHELTDLARTLPGVANFNVAVKQWQGRIVFLRRLVEGGASRSYGIEVARLAGLPEEVIKRAKEVLDNLETGELDETGRPRIAASELLAQTHAKRQLDLFSGGDDAKKTRLLEEIDSLAVEEMTPMEALVRLDEFRKKARELLRGKKG